MTARNNSATPDIIPQEIIERKIFYIRGNKVMLDSDLAPLYGVETKYLKRAVRRNIERFPADFMFRLTRPEYNSLRCAYKIFALRFYRTRRCHVVFDFE